MYESALLSSVRVGSAARLFGTIAILACLGVPAVADEAERLLRAVSERTDKLTSVTGIKVSYQGAIHYQSDLFKEEYGGYCLIRRDVIRLDAARWQTVEYSQFCGTSREWPSVVDSWWDHGDVQVFSETVQQGEYVSCYENHQDGKLQSARDVFVVSYPDGLPDFIRTSSLELSLGVFHDHGTNSSHYSSTGRLEAYDVPLLHTHAKNFVVSGEEEIDGRVATIIEWSGVTRLWIDQDNPGAVLRREVYGPFKKYPEYIWEYSGHSIRDGLLLPGSIIQKKFDEHGEPYTETRYQLRELQTDASKLALRQPQVPIGTPIGNLEGRPIFPYYPREANPDNVILAIAEIRERTAEATHASPWYFRIFVASVCLAGLAIVARMIRNRRS